MWLWFKRMFILIILVVLLSLSGYYLYYKARYEMVRLKGVPVLYDRWTDKYHVMGKGGMGQGEKKTIIDTFKAPKNRQYSK